MSRLIEIVGPFAPVVVMVLAAAESAAFLGVFVPGELAVILGGVAAGAGKAPLAAMIVAAVTGAIVGDSVGYRLGKRLGPRFVESTRMRRIAPRMDRATSLISQRGWWALVLARFAAVLRAIVPFAAGMGHMPYRRFLLGNAVGGVLWGATFTVLGYVAGANYGTVEHWIRTGGLVVVLLLLVTGGIAWATRWAQRNQVVVAQIIERVLTSRPVRFVTSPIRRARRPVVGLGLSALAITTALWVFGGLLQDVLGSEEFFFFDISSIGYLARNHTPIVVSAAKAINTLTSPVVVSAAALVVAAVMLALGRSRVATAIAVAVVGVWAIVEMTGILVGRMPPTVKPLVDNNANYGFPSLQVALLACVAIVAAWPWVARDWKKVVFAFGIAALVTAASAFSRVILLVEYPSDVIAAAAVASAWTLSVCTVLATSTATDPAGSSSKELQTETCSDA